MTVLPSAPFPGAFLEQKLPVESYARSSFLSQSFGASAEFDVHARMRETRGQSQCSGYGSGRSVTNFQKPKPERPLFPKAAAQIGRNWVKLGSANGQKRTFRTDERDLLNSLMEHTNPDAHQTSHYP
jgi:hypothetical protein